MSRINEFTAHYLVTLSLTLVPVALAQDSQSPSPAIQSFEPLLGTWAGSGTIQESPTTTRSWTAVSRFDTALQGFVIQEHVVARVDGYPTLHQLTVYGHDTSSDRNIAVNLTSDGKPCKLAFSFPTKSELVTLSSYGPTSSCKTSYSLAESGYLITSTLRLEDGQVLAIKGEYQRQEKPAGAQASAVDAAGSKPSLRSEMARLAVIVGDYSVQHDGGRDAAEGLASISFRPMIGYDGIVEINDTGSFAGQVYRALGYLWWNCDERCYEKVSFDNLGHVRSSVGCFSTSGKAIVMTCSHVRPSCGALREVLVIGDGGLKSLVVHSMADEADPLLLCRATLSRTR